jgi:tetratricopeptide (TPR) repeat protein
MATPWKRPPAIHNPDMARTLRWAVLLWVGGSGSLLAQAPTPAQEARETVKGYLAARPGDREAWESRLRSKQAGTQLLDAVLAEFEAGRSLPSGALDLLFEILPAGESERVYRLIEWLSVGGKQMLLDWMARRDLKGFRDVEEIRAARILSFLDEERALRLRAAEELRNWDLPLVSQALDKRIRTMFSAGVPEDRELAKLLAESLARMRGGAEKAVALLPILGEAHPWLLPSLLPALAFVPQAVLDGALDPWIRWRHPAIRIPILGLVPAVDSKLFEEGRHSQRLLLFRRFRQIDGRLPEWAFREAHVALFDLADPKQAHEALAILDNLRLEQTQQAELLAMRAVAVFLEGGDPSDLLESAHLEAVQAFEADPDLLHFGRSEDVLGAQQIFEVWRKQVPPRLDPRDLQGIRERVLQSGGAPFAGLRNAGRRRLAVSLLASCIQDLRGKKQQASQWLDRANVDWQGLDNPQIWDEDRLGPNAMLDEATGLRTGPLDLMRRCLEGNETSTRQRGPLLAKRETERAEQSFRNLVIGLHERMPDRVLGLPGSAASRTEEGESEKVFSDITPSLGRFLDRIGETEKSLALVTHLVDALSETAKAANRRGWAAALFQRAALLMDLRRGPEAEKDLLAYVRHFEEKMQDVQQNPDRFYNPKGAENYFKSFVVNGYISLAVCNNVVMGKVQRAMGYCRKAYTLSDSPFNRVLYACYLARDGKKARALSLVDSIDPSPTVYYNLACTYAMVGDVFQALRYLELDLHTNHLTAKARNRQRKWAREDKDFQALRENLRFQSLVQDR